MTDTSAQRLGRAVARSLFFLFPAYWRGFSQGAREEWDRSWFGRYLDGAWVKYAAVFLIGMAAQRFFVEPRSQGEDAVALSIGLAICALILGLRWIINRQ